MSEGRPAAIYCRVSSDPTGERLGIDRQEEACRRSAGEHGWTLVETYLDNDMSAFSGVLRPGYRRMLDDARLGRLCAVVAWDLDRLHRSTKELEEFIEILEDADIPLVTVTGGDADLESSTGRLQARIKGTVARYESEHRSERVKTALEAQARKGRWSGGGRPFGYDVARDNHGRPLNDGRLVQVPEEAEYIREAARRVIGGESVYSVVKDFVKREIPTARGADWRDNSLRRILTSPTTAGSRIHGDEVVASGLWEPILSPDEHKNLNEILAPSEKARRPRHRYLLTGGIALCGKCGTRLHSLRTAKDLRSYKCYSGPDKWGCGGISASESATDRVVASEVLLRLGRDTAGGIDELARLFVAGQLSGGAWRLARGAIEDGKWQPALGVRAEPSHAHPVALSEWQQLEWAERRQRVTQVLDHVIVKPSSRRGSVYDAGRLLFLWRDGTVTRGRDVTA